MNYFVDLLMLFGAIFTLAAIVTTLLCDIADKADEEKYK
jgi:hypothetical protein